MKVRALTLIGCCLLACTALSAPARANCTSPAGLPGAVTWNGTDAVIWCDGTTWHSLADDGGSTITEAAGDAGQIQFNDGSDALAADAGLYWNNTDKRLTVGAANYTLFELRDTRNSGIRGPHLLFSDGLNAQANIAMLFEGTTYRDKALEIRTTVDGRINFYRDNSTVSTNLLMTMLDNGNVGIGTVTPAVTLHTTGGFIRTDGSSAYGLQLFRDGASVGTITTSSIRLSLNDASGNGIQFLNNSAATNMLIENGGNVGIGTTGPQSKLQVAGGIQLADDAATCPGASNIKLGTLKYASNVLSVCNTGGWTTLTATGGSLSGGTSGYLGVWTGATSMGLSGTAAAQNLFWDSTNHRLGIGTATPAGKLQVVGPNNTDLVTWLTSQGTGSSFLELGVTGSTAEIQGTSTGDLYLSHFGVAAGAFKSLRTGAVTNTLVLNAGNVGIGTPSPLTKLSVQVPAGDPALRLTDGTNETLVVGFSAGGTHFIRGTGATWLSQVGGNVGIGTVPASKLHVAGGIQLGDDTATCPGASNVKVGTLRFNTGNLQLCASGGWGSLSGGGSTLAAGDTGQIQFNGGSDVFAADAALHWDNTNKRLGIGTATPAAPLHVKNTVGNFAIGYTSATSYSEQSFMDEGDLKKWSTGVMGDNFATSGQRNAFYIYQYRDQADANVGAYRLYISDQGNVGIGTTTPQSTLQVAGGIQLGDDTATCPGTASIKLGTIRYASNTLSICATGGWTALATGTGITALTGEVTASGTGSVAATIANNAVTTAKIANSNVTNAKLANMAASTVKGNDTGSAAAPVDMTMAQLRAVIGTGTPGAGNFLRGDGTWNAPAGDNLGNHTATTTLALGANALTSSGGTVIDAGGGWHRTYGNTGWYNGTYAGGWYMTDVTYIRNYGSKQVYLDANITAPQFLYTSDERLKSHIETLPDALDRLSRIRGISFHFKGGDGKPHLGVVAQEIQKEYPQAVTTDEKGFLRVDYPSLIGPLIEAVKELKAENDNLRETLEEQGRAIDALTQAAGGAN